jgi:hypothetical protein
MPGKRSVSKSLALAARLLGKRGGPARAEALTKGQRREIASMGGKAKAAKKHSGG